MPSLQGYSVRVTLFSSTNYFVCSNVYDIDIYRLCE